MNPHTQPRPSCTDCDFAAASLARAALSHLQLVGGRDAVQPHLRLAGQGDCIARTSRIIPATTSCPPALTTPPPPPPCRLLHKLSRLALFIPLIGGPWDEPLRGTAQGSGISGCFGHIASAVWRGYRPPSLRHPLGHPRPIPPTAVTIFPPSARSRARGGAAATRLLRLLLLRRRRPRPPSPLRVEAAAGRHRGARAPPGPPTPPTPPLLAPAE
jgi:hypothetical protein